MRLFYLEGIEALVQRAWRKESVFLNYHGPWVPLNFPDISLSSLHFTLPEKRKKLSEKNHRSSVTLTSAESHRNLAKRESGRKISPELSRKLNPTCSFQCRKWDRELLCWKILSSVLISLHFLWEPRLSIQPVHSLRATKTVKFLKIKEKISKPGLYKYHEYH